MKVAELRTMPESELVAQVKKLREEIFHLRFKAATEPVTDPGAIRRARKEIARIHTILRERKLEAGEGGLNGSNLTREGRKRAQQAQDRLAAVRAKKARRRAAGTKKMAAK
jgi:large subunit ribosomal protein L29